MFAFSKFETLWSKVLSYKDAKRDLKKKKIKLARD